MNLDATRFQRLTEARLAERYEAVRKGRAIDGSGRTVLVLRGVIAGMHACAICTATAPPVREGPSRGDGPVAGLDAGTLVSPAVRSEFVRVLAGMVSGVCGR